MVSNAYNTRIIIDNIINSFVYFKHISSDVDHSKLVLVKYGGNCYPCKYQKLKQFLVFDNTSGMYVFKQFLNFKQYTYIDTICVKNTFPYTFQKKYGTHEMSYIFKNVQQKFISDEIKTLNTSNYSKYFDYTFGIEYETSIGVLPQNECFDYGLIPLRDGSISSVEYSTIVMRGDLGLQYIDKQMSLLKKYTKYDKNCSLHIHFGGITNLNPRFINLLYYVCYSIQSYIKDVMPFGTFNSDMYKSSGKNYCKLLSKPEKFNFSSLYTMLTDSSFKDRTIYDPHPLDPDRHSKWNCYTRYTWLNFTNLIAYENGKTLELRFLRPTHNPQIVYLWMFIISAIIKFCELHSFKEVYNKFNSYDLFYYIMNSILPKDIVDIIQYSLDKRYVNYSRRLNNLDDLYGRDENDEIEFFSSLKILNNYETKK